MQMPRTQPFYDREMQAIRSRQIGILAPTPVADRNILIAESRFRRAIDGSLTQSGLSRIPREAYGFRHAQLKWVAHRDRLSRYSHDYGLAIVIVA
jgi:hypothetical protein